MSRWSWRGRLCSRLRARENVLRDVVVFNYDTPPLCRIEGEASKALSGNFLKLLNLSI
jgi:hypothetical protein